jgi:putative ABC transport system permease protein
MTASQLALSNLWHDKARSAISIIGAAFAVVLIFMQLGFLGALENTATLLYDRLRFDLLITSKEYLDFSRSGSVKRDRLAQALGVNGVNEVIPLTVAPGLWRNPTDDPKRGGQSFQITMLSVDPAKMSRTFLPEEHGIFASTEDQAAAKSAISRLNTVFLDERSRPDFGPIDAMPPGTVVELNGKQIELSGRFRIGTGFSYTGLLIMNEETFGNVTGRPVRNTTLGLVQLEDGQDPELVAERLRLHLPDDVQVFTRAEISEYERSYWITKTAVGKFFNFGVLLALMVGAIFVYQMMVADIKKHLPEYATLKAMGYRFSYLFGVVFWQAVLLAICGFSIGLVMGLGLYEVTRSAAQLPVEMTLERMFIVLGLTLAMCIGSGLVAVRKVQTADPADLF